MKRLILALCFIFALTGGASALSEAAEDAVSISAPSAILIESSTGTVIYEKNAHEHLSPASVTKVMTLLIAAEEIDAGRLSLDDTVTASAHAASMGGSQIWLEEGEQMTVSELIKCIAVVSANDCCVALAEHISGSEAAFVERMNERAAELGMDDTHFTCCSGLLESDEHYSCARDIAVMSRELLGHAFIKDYTTIWMDTVRDGEFSLANTNKLIYHYEGATGLKTGYTARAGYCLAASAERDGTEYIAVVLKGESSSERFEDAKTLLSFAFANYSLCDPAGSQAIPPVSVELGEKSSLQPVLADGGRFLTEKSSAASLEYELELAESVKAPVAEEQSLGLLRVSAGGETLAEIELVAPEAVPRLTLGSIFLGLLSALAGVE